MPQVIALQAQHSFSSLRPTLIERRIPGANEVAIEVDYCGICHSDVHQAKNDWHNTIYPCTPGHEIIGRVTAAGSAVTKYKVGDRVGVGCMVDSCRECKACKDGLEQYCERGFLATYNGNMRKPTKDNNTFGGYSASITLRQEFVLKIPDALDSAAAAPILCAGVTTFSPMKHWKVGPGTNMAVIGFGGLGQMALKIGKALGATVSVITEKDEKREDALRLGAKEVIVSKDADQMKAHELAYDFMISTIPKQHDANPYVSLVKRDGVLVIVGCLMPLTLPLGMAPMVTDRKTLSTSLIGSIAETQEVLDLCAKHGIASDVKVISVEDVNDAFAAVDRGTPDFRYVIDMATIRTKKPDASIAAKIGL